MMLGTPTRSTGLVYQKLAPLVSDAFSSRVRSVTSGMLIECLSSGFSGSGVSGQT
jgi:hypothetical protein